MVVTAVPQGRAQIRQPIGSLTNGEVNEQTSTGLWSVPQAALSAISCQ